MNRRQYSQFTVQKLFFIFCNSLYGAKASSEICLSFIYVQWRILEEVTKNARHSLLSLNFIRGVTWTLLYQKKSGTALRKEKQEESSNSILPCGRVCWKQEPKGVITYTPKSDMTIHLGVVAAGGGEAVGGEGCSRPLDSLTPHCQLGLAGSYFPLCLRHRRAADKNIHNSRQADPRGVGFRFFLSFHSQKLQLS